MNLNYKLRCEVKITLSSTPQSNYYLKPNWTCQDSKKFKHFYLVGSGSFIVSIHPAGQKQIGIWSLVLIGRQEASTATESIVLQSMLCPWPAWGEKASPGCLLDPFFLHHRVLFFLGCCLLSRQPFEEDPFHEAEPIPSLLTLNVLFSPLLSCPEDCPSCLAFLFKTFSLHFHNLFPLPVSHTPYIALKQFLIRKAKENISIFTLPYSFPEAMSWRSAVCLNGKKNYRE